MSYKALEQERIEIAYAVKAPSVDVVRYLKDRWIEPTSEVVSGFQWRNQRRLLEFLLYRRNDALVDWGIARFGNSISTIQKVFDRGDVGTRVAAAANPFGGSALKQCGEILRCGKWPILRALLQNPWLPSSFLANLLARKEEFADISDDRFWFVVAALRCNTRLSRPYKSIRLDGFAEYRYARVASAVWNLTATMPATQKWASVIAELLTTCERPPKFDDLEQTINRWRIDEKPKHDPPGRYDRSLSFYLRSHLADLMEADETLGKADDPALRMSFYRRFLPRQFRDWPEFLNRDGEEFFWAALENERIWQSGAERGRLREVCGRCPDPSGDTDMPNAFATFRNHYEQEHPDWFAMKAPASLLELGDRLRAIEEELSLRSTERPTMQPMYPEMGRPVSWLAAIPWWVWLLAGVLIAIAFCH